MKIEVTQCSMCTHYNTEQYCEVWEQYITNDAFYCACGAKADRKTENSSEFPNNCEHITEDGVTCAKYPACDDCLDNPLNKVKGSERLVKGSEQTDCLDRYDRKPEPTISKMEQVDKDIYVRSKTEPQTHDLHTNTHECVKINADQHVQRIEYVENVKRCRKCKHIESEHQTPIASDGEYYTYVVCMASECNYEPNDEPTTQTETQNSNLTFEKRKCIDCNFLTYMFGKTWCNIKCENPHDKVCDRFKPKDEPQTDYGDYERAVEQMQHDMLYEPTYNAEDGSM